LDTKEIMNVKICGITSLADARYAAGAGADFLGYIQHPDSPRYILPEKVAEINAWVFGSKSVGVFVDESADHVNRIADIANFDLVQLHGNESVATCEEINSPVIKVFKVRSGDSAYQIAQRMEPYLDCSTYFLLDAYNKDEAGGTGQTISWKVAGQLAGNFSFFLAGGLNSDNVAVAVNAVHPFGLDVSSGLESEPGHKDFELITRFMEIVRPPSDP